MEKLSTRQKITMSELNVYIFAFLSKNSESVESNCFRLKHRGQNQNIVETVYRFANEENHITADNTFLKSCL